MSRQPVELILIAQVTNALLLPLLALILIVLAARTSIMGQHASRGWQSGVAVLAAIVCGYLSVQRFSDRGLSRYQENKSRGIACRGTRMASGRWV